ncbi:adenosylcobinamide-GDP ribazoletransferase [uncultured Rhodoblastus sp.]|uniref:adenosylcobinamide-GDP ribazoletransferase n=1 Tax=uncultured Rhodoblastus sp. TaxID=543037 RepID=UPI0025F59AFA|nr:adenosylcobinamide-GDP ribazoletransferase [uncultured Rhodoblastus sp.]
MNWKQDLVACLGFFSRLPLPHAPGAADFPRPLRLAPLAGALLGLASAIPFGLALHFNQPPAVAALLALATATLLSGGLHEDGLADVADGFGGGFSRQSKLEIMRDSRIGAFGASALILSFGLRAAALAALAATPGRAVAVLAAAGALSRLCCLAPLLLLAPARADGAGRAAALTVEQAKPALTLALAFSLLPWFAGFTLATALAAPVLAGGVVWGFCQFARAQIGGQTGDVAGAAQQISEIAVLMVYAGAAV